MFPGLVWCKGLLSCVDFLAVTRQAPFVRINGAGSSPLFLPLSLLFLWLFFLALWRGCPLLCHVISMKKIFVQVWMFKESRDVRKDAPLAWGVATLLSLRWFFDCSSECHMGIQYQVILIEERKALLIIHKVILAGGNEILAILYLLGVLSWDSVFWDEGSCHGWEYWRSDVEEEMKDKAVLAPTCHKFSSLAIDPSSSKNTVSFCLQLFPPISQSSAKAVALQTPQGSCVSQTCRPPSWFLPGAHLSSLLFLTHSFSQVSSIGQPGET